VRKLKLTKGLPLALAALSLAGVVVSGYLTWQALITPVGACPLVLSGFFGCSAVLSSQYARIGDMPTALFGLVWFIVAVALSLGIPRNRRLIVALLAWSVVGLVGVAGLVYIELFIVGAICPFCTAAHLLGLAVFGLAVLLWKRKRGQRSSMSRAS